MSPEELARSRLPFSCGEKVPIGKCISQDLYQNVSYLIAPETALEASALCSAAAEHVMTPLDCFLHILYFIRLSSLIFQFLNELVLYLFQVVQVALLRVMRFGND